MNSRRFISCASFALPLLLVATPQVKAQISNVRVSVKIVLDSTGARPTDGLLGSDEQILAAFAAANDILVANGADWRLDPTEVVDLRGVSQWFGPWNCRVTHTGFEAAAEANRALYQWRSDAINPAARLVAC